MKITAEELQQAYECLLDANLPIYDVGKSTPLLTQRLFPKEPARAEAIARRLQALAALIAEGHLPPAAFAFRENGRVTLNARVFTVAARQPVLEEQDHCRFDPEPFTAALQL